MGANIDAVEVAGHIGIDARRAVNYHADSRGTKELFHGVASFASGFVAAPPASRFDDDEWRKMIDEDFEERKRGK